MGGGTSILGWPIRSIVQVCNKQNEETYPGPLLVNMELLYPHREWPTIRRRLCSPGFSPFCSQRHILAVCAHAQPGCGHPFFPFRRSLGWCHPAFTFLSAISASLEGDSLSFQRFISLSKETRFSFRERPDHRPTVRRQIVMELFNSQ